MSRFAALSVSTALCLAGSAGRALPGGWRERVTYIRSAITQSAEISVSSR